MAVKFKFTQEPRRISFIQLGPLELSWIFKYADFDATNCVVKSETYPTPFRYMAVRWRGKIVWNANEERKKALFRRCDRSRLKKAKI